MWIPAAIYGVAFSTVAQSYNFTRTEWMLGAIAFLLALILYQLCLQTDQNKERAEELHNTVKRQLSNISGRV